MASNHKRRWLVATIAISFALPALAGTEDDVRAQLTAKGYTEVSELEYENGIWDADVTRADGSRGEVAVDDQGEVYDGKDGRPLLDESDLFAKLTNAGYGGVNDIEREGAIFTADAYDKSGNKVELTISAYDGHVIHEERDDD